MNRIKARRIGAELRRWTVLLRLGVVPLANDAINAAGSRLSDTRRHSGWLPIRRHLAELARQAWRGEKEEELTRIRCE